MHESALDSSHHYKNYFTSGITNPNSKPPKNSSNNNNNNSYTSAQNPPKKKPKKHKRTKSITLPDKHQTHQSIITNNLSLKNCSSTVNTNHHTLHPPKSTPHKPQPILPKKPKTNPYSKPSYPSQTLANSVILASPPPNEKSSPRGGGKGVKGAG